MIRTFNAGIVDENVNVRDVFLNLGDGSLYGIWFGDVTLYGMDY